MSKEVIKVPDLGGAEAVEVIEIPVAVGDIINVDDTMIVLESDKASMDVPSPKAGKVVAILVKEGDSLSDGDAILELEPAAQDQGAETAAEAPAEAAEAKTEAPELSGTGLQERDAVSLEKTVEIPALGTEQAVEIVEITVAVGDQVAEGDSLLVLESEKSSMEVPAPCAGEVKDILVKEGAKVRQGDPIIKLLSAAAADEPRKADEPAKPKAADPTKSEVAKTENRPVQARAESATAAESEKSADHSSAEVYAGPAVRHLARELGVDLARVSGSGPKKRILKEDVNQFVKQALRQPARSASAGAGIPPVPDMDFSQFGPIEEVELSRIARLTAENMTRNWLNVPAVTQFDDADITDLEEFRKGLKAEAEQRGSKLTLLPFLVLASARALAANPVFNRSWHSSGEKVIQKHYVHIGIAVDSPRGLVVPVLRDVDKKGLWELAEEIGNLAAKARDGKLSAAEMQGGCFSISSLGALGGTGFTPIINSPEAAILGVSKATVKPVWNGSEFTPRQMLPLSLTYDHRLINGADAGRFMHYLLSAITDLRRLLL